MIYGANNPRLKDLIAAGANLPAAIDRLCEASDGRERSISAEDGGELLVLEPWQRTAEGTFAGLSPTLRSPVTAIPQLVPVVQIPVTPGNQVMTNSLSKMIDVYHSGGRRVEGPFLLATASTPLPDHPAPGTRWTYWKRVPLREIAVLPALAGDDVDKYGFHIQ